MTDIAIIDPEREQARIGAVIDATADLVLDAEAVLVRDDAEAQLATDFLSKIAGEKRRADEARRFLVDPLNAHVKAINARFKGPAAILEQADRIVRAKVIAYRAGVERKRQEEIRRLEAEERERQRVEREAREKQEAQARALAEQAAAQARAAEQATADDEAAATARRDAAAFADATAALAAQRAAAPVPTALQIREPERQRTLGAAASRKRWVGEVVDASLVPREYLVVDQRLVNAAVKRGVREITGVRIEERDELAVRAT